MEVSSEKRQSVASVVGTLDISVHHPKERKNKLNFGTMVSSHFVSCLVDSGLDHLFC